jgi:hypothetical protein
VSGAEFFGGFRTSDHPGVLATVTVDIAWVWGTRVVARWCRARTGGGSAVSGAEFFGGFRTSDHPGVLVTLTVDIAWVKGTRVAVRRCQAHTGFWLGSVRRTRGAVV